MAEFSQKRAIIDCETLSNDQSVEVYEGGVIWLHDNGTGQDIELDAQAASKLYDFLLLHRDRIHRAAQAKKEAHS